MNWAFIRFTSYCNNVSDKFADTNLQIYVYAIRRIILMWREN